MTDHAESPSAITAAPERTSAGGLIRSIVVDVACPWLAVLFLEGRIRCAYHHWRFDEAGICVHIPTDDKILPGARIFTYPTAEA